MDFPTINLSIVSTWVKFITIYRLEFDKVSEWLLLNANSTIFQLHHGENKLIFNEMMMRSALY